MDNTKNVVLFGVVAVAVGGAFFYMKQQKDKSDANLRMAQAEADAIVQAQEVALATPPAYTRRIEVATSSSGNWMQITNSKGNRAKASASLGIGDQGMVNGTIPCTVSKFWMDSKGRKGALKCEGMDYYDISDGSRFEY